MLLRLIILLTVVPLVELVLLLRLADWMSWQWTFLLVLVTGALGAFLARREGLRAMNKVMAEVSRGALPAGALVEGMLVLVAGVLLVTPGLLTDLCGFSLLVPTIRSWVGRKLSHALQVKVAGQADPDAPDPFVDVVPTEARDISSHDVLDGRDVSD